MEKLISAKEARKLLSDKLQEEEIEEISTIIMRAIVSGRDVVFIHKRYINPETERVLKELGYKIDFLWSGYPYNGTKISW